MKLKLKAKKMNQPTCLKNKNKHVGAGLAPAHNRGITLVALIITIIVLLILAVVAITSISKNNIIKHAQNAGKTYIEGDEKEKIALAIYEARTEGEGTITQKGIENGMTTYFGAKGTNWSEESSSDKNTMIVEITKSKRKYKIALGTGTIESVTGEDETISSTRVEDNTQRILSKTDNKTLEDRYGNQITIPAGFKIVVDDTTGYSKDTIDVTKGIVIEDEEENQFVWIPVNEVKNEEKTVNITLGRYKDFSKDSNGNYTPVQKASDYQQEVSIQLDVNFWYIEQSSASTNSNFIAENLARFCNSTVSKGGYYIGRYEARVENYDSSNIATTNDMWGEWTGYNPEDGKELKLVLKSNAQVWNYVTQNKAATLCRDMYINKTFKSDLVNSYAWDTAIIFFQEFGENSDYANTSISRSISNTGSTTDKTCNVYDIASNCGEWITETGGSQGSDCTVRADYYHYTVTSSRASYSPSNANDNTSFRPILYL